MSAASRFHRLRRPALGLVLWSPLLGAPALASPPSLGDPSALAVANQLGKAFSKVAEQASPSVVSIQVEMRREVPNFGFFFPFGQQEDGGIQRGGGSGVILTQDGAILTNNHVVEHADRIEVRLQDGRRFKAKVLGVDPATDLAVLKIDAQNLPAARFADSDAAQVGQWVVAIGSPFGLDYTVTAGVLSAKGRGGLGANEIEDYLQTDASINPGNSGGPLVNLSGEVLGINTMIIGRASGIGFAIPANLARKVGMELLEKGDVSRAWIGVSYQELTPELAAGFGTKLTRGALVSEVVPDGPAARAGLKPGDIITEIGGRQVQEGRDLLRAVLQSEVGKPLSVTVVRSGHEKKLSVVTAERPNGRELAAGERDPRRQRGAANDKGLALAALTPELARRLGYDGKHGVVVSNVRPGSPADRAGLMRGDVIEEVNRRPATSPRQVDQALSKPRTLLRIQRHGGTFFVVIQG